MDFTDYLPISRSPTPLPSSIAREVSLDAGSQKGIAKLFKVRSLALGFMGLSGLVGRRTTFEVAPYDLERINKAIDTDSFIRQGINKYKELLWKEGWDVVGENDAAVAYIRERFDFMEMAMGRSFQSFLVDVGDQLVRYHNVFIAKARGDLSQYFPGTLSPEEGKDPVVGYYIIPAETVEIQRNRQNEIVAYRQRLDAHAFGQSILNQRERQPRWPADEVIHLSMDRKPGRLFGTPFLVSVLDDVVALRQLEEDIQNLVHKELSPLYKYKVGTEQQPAEPEEIEQAWLELENLRNDGGLILPERHEVEVIGAEGAALEASGYLAHFVNRVITGLGLAPHHLGLMNEGGNRAVTDRLDIALYDKAKSYQRYLSDMIRIKVLNELLFEGGFDPVMDPADGDVSDRCEFTFNEIDIDTQVKKENHEIQKFVQNIIGWEEMRNVLGLESEGNEEDLLVAITARLQAKYMPLSEGQKAPPTTKPDGAGSSTGGRANPRNTTKGVGNRSRPANQHGRRTSPNIRHSDIEWATDIVELLDEENEQLD